MDNAKTKLEILPKNIFGLFFVFSLIIIGSFVFTNKASAATYYVSPSGSNTSPYDTWTKAAPNPQTVLTAFDLNPGDIIELDGGTSGISYSSTGTAVIDPATNDAGVIIKGSTESDHNGVVTIDGTVNTNAAINISAGRTGITFQNMLLKPGNGKYAILDYAQTTLIDLTLDGSASNQRLILLSGSFSTTGARLKLTDCTSPNYCIYAVSGAQFTLSASHMSGGWGSAGGSNDSYVFVSSGSLLVSNNNSYTDLPLGAFLVTGVGSTVTSNNDMFIGLNRLYGPQTLGMFKVTTPGAITLNNPLYTTGGRAPSATYVAIGSNITINNSITNVLPEVIHHKRNGLVSIVVDSSAESFVDDSIALGDQYGIPLSFAVNKNSLMGWGANEAEVKTTVLALTQSPHLAHEFVSHTISHPHLTDSQAFTATYSGTGAGTIIVGGVYPSQVVTVTSNGPTVATLDTTVTSYGINHRNLSTITGLSMAIDDLADWTIVEGTSGGTFSSSLRVGTTVVTTNTSIPFDIDTDYNFWKDEIVGMTNWLESFMGLNYTKAFVIPYAMRTGVDYSEAWQTWMNANIATTHVGGARTMNSSEETAPISTMIPNNLSQIMGIGTVDTSVLFMPYGNESITEEQIRQHTRSAVVWAAETGALITFTIHELGLSSIVQFGYILDELAKAQAEGIITIKTFGGLVDYIRTSGLWTDAGNGQWNRTYTDQSDYHFKTDSPAIDSGTSISGLTTDYEGNPIYGTPDIGGYEYQPPHNLVVSDTIDIGAGARIYADGKFRDLGTINSVSAHLKITPESGSFTTYDTTTTRPAWLDVTNITNWTNTHKTWTESNAQTSNMVTDHTIGDLNNNKYYTITVSGASVSNISGINGTTCVNAVCISNDSGTLSFRYDGGYSPHTFDMLEDSTPPVTTATPAGGTYGASRDITLSCLDDASDCDHIYYTVDGTSPTTSSSVYGAPITIALNTTLKFFSTDLTGNPETPKTETYVIDTTYPVTDINSHPNTVTNSTSATFTFSANKTSTFECKLDTGSYISCSSPKDYTSLTEGSHTFLVKATDTLNHTEPSPPSFTFIIDSEAPSTAIAIPSADTYTSTQSVSLTSAGSDLIRYSTTETPADCSSGTLYTTPISVSTSQTIYVRACDNAGNSSTTNFAYVISRPTSSGSSALSRYNNLVDMGNIQAANELQQQYPNQITPTIPTPVVTSPTQTTLIITATPSTPIIINRILKLTTPRIWGDDIKALQTFLNTKGYNSGIPDGNFGPKTQTAVIAFQKANGLTPDGVVGPNTLKFMNDSQTTPSISTPLKTRTLKLSTPRMIGDDVLALQTYLSTNGYDVGIPDGIFGYKTQSAVIAFQTANGLTTDGIVGPLTRGEMNK